LRGFFDLPASDSSALSLVLDFAGFFFASGLVVFGVSSKACAAADAAVLDAGGTSLTLSSFFFFPAYGKMQIYHYYLVILNL